MEDKLNQAHIEVQQLKASVKNYEGMIDNYKSQVGGLREVSQEASPRKGRVERCFSLKLGPMLWRLLGDEDQTGG